MRRIRFAASTLALLSSTVLVSSAVLVSSTVFAQTPDISQPQFDDCLRTSVVSASESMTVQELRNACSLLLQQKQQAVQPVQEQTLNLESPLEQDESPRPLLTNRLKMEELNRNTRFVRTPRKRNYSSPLNRKSAAYAEPYEEADNQLQALDKTEVEFQ